MNDISAGQLIYTRVGKSDSPRGQAGFQTVFSTEGLLSPAEIKEIEARLVLDTNRERVTKRVFFQTTGGERVVVSRLLAVDTPDSSQRAGNYLAHALVFSKDEFANRGGNPFDIFRDFKFLESLEQAFAAGNQQSGDIPSTRVEITKGDGGILEFARSCRTKELEQLLMFASSISLVDEAAIAVTGTQTEIERVFELLLLVIPDELRAEFSFDTDFSGLRLQQTPTRAIGQSGAVSQRNCLTFDGHSCEFTSAKVDIPQSPYTNWVRAMVGAGKLEALIDNANGNSRGAAWMLSRIVAGEIRRQPTIAISSELACEFTRINRSQVAEAVRVRLCSQFGTALGKRAASKITRSKAALLVFPRLIEGFLPEDLVVALSSAYSESMSVPEKEEIDCLSSFVNKHGDAMLYVWLASFQDNSEEFYRYFAKLDDEQYRKFVRWVLQSGVLDASVVIAPGRGKSFVEEALKVGFCDEQAFASVVEAFLKLGEGEFVEELSPLLARETRRGLTAICRVAYRHSESVPEDFVEAVVKRREETQSGISRALRLFCG